MNKRGVLMTFNDSGIWIVAVLCYAIAIYAFTGKKPVHFWAGHKIRQYTIKKIKLYNFFNGIMWLFLAVYFSVGSYYAYIDDISRVYILYQIFMRYILLIMIIYYSIIWYCFKIK